MSCSAAQSNAQATYSGYKEPASFEVLIATIVALGATASTPYALCAAAMVPATCVPAASATALASAAVVCGCSVRTSEPVTVL